MNEATSVGLGVMVVIGISQVAKTSFKVKTQYIPLLNLVLAILMSTFFMSDITLQDRILHGLVIGLSASGLFDQTKILKDDSNKKSKS